MALMKLSPNANAFLFVFISLIALFIGCESRRGNSNSCDCYSWSGDETYMENGSCMYCQTCTNDVCSCPSQKTCEDIGSTTGIIAGVIIIMCCVACCVQARRKGTRGGLGIITFGGRRGPIVAGHVHHGGRAQPAVYQPTTTTQPQTVVIQQQQPAVLYVDQNGNPIQPQQQQQPAVVYVDQNGNPVQPPQQAVQQQQPAVVYVDQNGNPVQPQQQVVQQPQAVPSAAGPSYGAAPPLYDDVPPDNQAKDGQVTNY